MVCVKAANPTVVLKKQGMALKEGKISRIRVIISAGILKPPVGHLRGEQKEI
jgi:hypothetical protein